MIAFFFSFLYSPGRVEHQPFYGFIIIINIYVKFFVIQFGQHLLLLPRLWSGLEFTLFIITFVSSCFQ